MPTITANLTSTDPKAPVWEIVHGPTRLAVTFVRAAGDAVAAHEKWQVTISLPALDIHFAEAGATRTAAFDKALEALRVNGVRRGSPVLDLRAIQAELVRKQAFRAPV